MEHEAGNKFNYEFGKLMEKHKMAAGMMFFHAGETPFNDVELVFVGNPSLDWICAGADNLVTEMEKRIAVKKISSGVRGFGEVTKNDE